jgi:hypothetical protein
MQKLLFIIYVKDQNKSKDFYKNILVIQPVLDVPGMTEFQLNVFTKIGIMPETGIAKILGNKVPNPANANGIPKCELYLFVDNPQQSYVNAVNNSAIPINETKAYDWGDEVAYCADTDGNIIAFARTLS